MNKQKPKGSFKPNASSRKIENATVKITKTEQPSFYRGVTDPLTLVIKALENPKYKYRTTSGIVKETRLEPSIVANILSSNDNLIRRAIIKAPDGSELYASKKKVNGLQDFWTTIKAINSAKFGG